MTVDANQRGDHRLADRLFSPILGRDPDSIFIRPVAPITGLPSRRWNESITPKLFDWRTSSMLHIPGRKFHRLRCSRNPSKVPVIQTLGAMPSQRVGMPFSHAFTMDSLVNLAASLMHGHASEAMAPNAKSMAMIGVFARFNDSGKNFFENHC